MLLELFQIKSSVLTDTRIISVMDQGAWYIKCIIYVLFFVLIISLQIIV